MPLANAHKRANALDNAGAADVTRGRVRSKTLKAIQHDGSHTLAHPTQTQQTPETQRHTHSQSVCQIPPVTSQPIDSGAFATRTGAAFIAEQPADEQWIGADELVARVPSPE